MPRHRPLGRADSLSRLDRHKEALPDWARALELDEGKDRRQSNFLRYRHALTLAQLKQHARAAAEADALVKTEDAAGYTLYHAARVYAVTSSVVSDVKQADQYGARAVELLRQLAERAPCLRARLTGTC